jgi:hypothetical protein
MLAWRSRFDVLVLETQNSAKNFQDIADEISTILIECVVEKKFIFVSSRECNIQQKMRPSPHVQYKAQEEYDDWKFTDIVTESTMFLLEKKVTFQCTEIQIKNLVKEIDFRMLNALDCDSLSLLLANEKPSIGTPTENPLEYYINRTLECITNVKNGIHTESKVNDPFRKDCLDEWQSTSEYREEKCNKREHGQGIPHFLLVDGNKEKARKRQFSGNHG